MAEWSPPVADVRLAATIREYLHGPDGAVLLGQLLASFQDLLGSSDVSGTITAWNEAAWVATLGWQPDELEGRPFAELVHPEDLPALAAAHQRVMQGEAFTGLLFRARCKDGTYKLLEGSGRLLPGLAVSLAVMRDITHRRQLSEAEARLAAIVESTADAVLSFDAEGLVQTWNPSAERMYGYTAAEMVGRPISVLIPDGHPNDERLVRSVVEHGGRVDQYETQRRCRDGTVVDVSLTVTPIRDETGRIVAAASIARDITERRRAEADLRAARLEAESASESKSRFLSQMSHELRTPLNAVIGFAQLLDLSGHLAGRDLENAGRIETAGRHLLALIDDILDVTQVETGRLPLSLEPVLVNDVVSRALELVRPLAEERGVDVRLAVRDDEADGPAPIVLADRRRLLQVVLNLVSNAIKYNHPGGRVSVASADGPAGATITVTDTGLGIDTFNLSRLFMPFERGDAALSAIEGTGLGLVLVKGLVEAMHGDVQVESELGRGSTFTVRLPRPPEDALPGSTPGGLAAAPSPRHDPGTRGSLLLVEDNPANRVLVEEALRHRPGVTLLTAGEAFEGLALASERQPGLVLLDMHLPDIPGLEVLRLLRASKATAAIPVVVVSADASPELAARCGELGAVGYLTKPVDVVDLLGVVDELLGRGRAGHLDGDQR